MLLTTRTNAALNLNLTVSDGAAGGVTGLSPTVRIRDGETSNSYLDFADDTFKTSGWAQQDVTLVEIGNGHYQYLLNVGNIVGLSDGDSFVAEFQETTLPFDQSEIVVVEEVQRLGTTVTVNDGGGVTGLSVVVRIRDATTTNKYLDWDDNTFKTSGWGTVNGPMAEVGRGHYTRLWNAQAASGLGSNAFIVEYHSDGPPIIDASESSTGLVGSTSSDVAPPIIDQVSPPVSTELDPTQSVSFRVRDESGQFCNVFVYVSFPLTGEGEWIHDGVSFSARYSGLSSRTAVVNGWVYTLRRSGGWPSKPSFRIKAIDAAGNESV